MNNIGQLQQTNITHEMKKAYLNYAMSVIVARALPDIRDGLKPVHRRILYAMHELSLHHSAKYKKSASVVGEVMGKYHPHGDVPIYDAMVRLAQDFSMRYPLIDGQGNFGSIDGDPPAAMRYTEARMAAITAEMLQDIDKETVDFVPNFDASQKEPVFLPAKLPNLLLAGSEGIAVGMATKIPPHNLTEVIDAITFMITKTTITENVNGINQGSNATVGVNGIPTEGTTEGLKISTGGVDALVPTNTRVHLSSDATIEDLLEFVKGPDFPTAGNIYDITEIKNAYVTGRGKIMIRGKAEIEDIGQGKSAIIITELPYQVNKAQLVAKIADLAKEKKIEGISDLRDESDRRGLRIYVELKRDATPKKILNNLFKFTSLQTSFPVNMVTLVDGTPQTVNLKLILEEYLKHRYLIVKRRSEFELKQAKARLHILEGLKIAVDHIDAVIKTIRESRDQEEAKKNLMGSFKLSEIQATAILDMQLRRLAALERQKIEDELLMIRETIAYLEDLLAHPEKILSVIQEEITKLKEKYGDSRRTKVYKGKVGEFSEEDLIPNEPTVVTLTQTGYIKRQSMNSFQTQHRGGKGINGMKMKEEDAIDNIRHVMTHDNLLFFTNKGKVYQLKAYEIGESSRLSKGTAIVNLLNIEQGEVVQSFDSYDSKKLKSGFIFLTTKNGTVKKSKLSEFENIRRGGMIAIKLDQGDELVWSNISTGTDEVVIVTRDGKAIRFSESAVRPMGRATTGVRGIAIGKDDQVISMDLITKGDNPLFLTLMENGLGKKTEVKQFPLQNRGGQGVKVAKVTDKTGKVVAAQVIPTNGEEVIITSKRGQVVKLELASVPKLSRDTQGVILMRFSNASDRIASATCITKEGTS
jgi:DNA gyrase subunit A